MNQIKRIFYSFCLQFMPNGYAVANFIKKHHLYGSIGDNCFIQKRKLPLYSNLIHLHDNVNVASNVGFITHDIIHHMLNHKFGGGFIEKIGCIEVMNNVFIGAGTRILYNTRIGNNVIIGADSLVNKDIPDNTVYAGVPARFICTFDEYIKKARAYSELFQNRYGLSVVQGVENDLAEKMYIEFLKEKNGKELRAL